MNDSELLRNFAETKSDAAFRSLVDRHLPLVFGTARRITRDEALAEDIAQTVFLLLARKAGEVSRESVLSGWFFRTTRFVSLRALRSEQRRRNREIIATTAMDLENSQEPLWRQISPELDEALASLNETDRRALLLRFFEGLAAAQVAQRLGLNEEAARKRLSRALEKLRQFFSRRGVEISAAALTAGLAREASAAVPLNLAEKINSAVPASLAAGGGAAVGWLLAEILSAMRWARIKFVAGAAAGFVAGILWLGQRQAVNSPAMAAVAGQNNGETLLARTNATKGTNSQGALPPYLEIDGQQIPAKGIRIVVLDAATSGPIAGAIVTHQLESLVGRKEFRTDSEGVAVFQIPAEMPLIQEYKQFQGYVRADGYGSRSIMWISSTGSVTRTMATNYTVKMQRAARIGGTVVDEAGEPIEGVAVSIHGSNYRGYTYSIGGDGKISSAPEIRVEDFSDFSASNKNSEMDGLVTGKNGRFVAENYPPDLEALILDFELTDGSNHRFTTDKENRLTIENLPKLSIRELRAQTARIQISRGVDVDGIVVDATGKPISGASVLESALKGNLRILSRNTTDGAGKFHLANRQPREVLLSASAASHGSISTLVTIGKGMSLVTLKLPVENPLYGRVADREGKPVAGATIRLVDYLNDGLGLQWEEVSAADGRFIWREAPTNEVKLMVMASGFSGRLARLKAGQAEHLITLQSGKDETLHFAGNVVDVTSNTPIPEFMVKIHSITSRAGTPDYLRKTVVGRDGMFSADLNLVESQIEHHGMLALVVEADGYETFFSEPVWVAEGDREFQIRFRPGGLIEGYILTPKGAPAEDATLVIAQKQKDAFLDKNGRLRGPATTTSDGQGHFRIRKPVQPVECLVAHDSGWARVAVPTGAEPIRIQLKPWATVEIQIDPATPRTPDSLISVRNFNSLQDSLQVFHSASVETERHEFTRLPAGEFSASLVPLTRVGMTYFYTMQTNFTLAAGEHRTIKLETEGVRATAVLKFPGDVKPIEGFLVALLSRDVAMPVKRGIEYYASNASFDEGTRRYNSDPAVAAARRRERAVFGAMDEKGVVMFPPVPPGRYILECKQAKIPDRQGQEPRVLFETRAQIEIPEGSGASRDLGVFQMEAR